MSALLHLPPRRAAGRFGGPGLRRGRLCGGFLTATRRRPPFDKLRSGSAFGAANPDRLIDQAAFGMAVQRGEQIEGLSAVSQHAFLQPLRTSTSPPAANTAARRSGCI